MPNHPKKYSLSFLVFLIFFLVATVNFAFILVDNLFFTIIGSVLFVAVLLIFLRVVIVPLTKLTAACEQVRKGNLDVKIENNHQTEINEFIGTFNEMVVELKKSRAAMEEAKDILEIRVKARTRQLQEIIDGQETTIRSRTKELEEQIKELERFRRLTVDRELKMINLKKEIKKLKSPTKND